MAQKGLPRPVSHADNGQVSGFLGFWFQGFKLRRSVFGVRRSAFFSTGSLTFVTVSVNLRGVNDGFFWGGGGDRFLEGVVL